MPRPGRARRAELAATGSRPHGREPGGIQPPGTPAQPRRWSAPYVVVALLATGCVLYAVTFRMSTPDVWQHLLVGKAMWQLGRVPSEHLWSWPSYGNHEVLPSWGFRALLWPFWLAGGEWGLQLWRWLTTLLAFGLGVATARRLGARGLTPLLVAAIAALSYRARAQVRPETLTAVLLALELWVLERRAGSPPKSGRGGALALVVIAWVWANAHISYYLGLGLIAIHALARKDSDPPLAGAPAGTPPDAWSLGVPAPGAAGWLQRIDRAPLPVVLAAAVAVSFANPFGWRALWQPAEYFFVWRHEPIYQIIPELTPLTITWRSQLSSGLPLLLVAWPLLAIGRALARRFDLVEALTCALFTSHALLNQRFSGALVVAMTPYLARDLSELAAALPVRRILLRPPVRAAIAALLMGLGSVPAWLDPRFPRGVGFVGTCYPSTACDFIERHGLRGRLFNPYYFGGYVLWRFWPQKDRLPFMDIHQSGTRADRDLYAYAFADSEDWRTLDERHHFDLALLDGHQEWVAGDRLLDVLDADPRWALVFRDDAAALYVRREGALGPAADSLAYRIMPGGAERFGALGGSIARDSTARRALRAELERRADGSPFNAQASLALASIDFIDGDRAAARRHLEHSIAVEPRIAGAHLRLGYLAMSDRDWRRAIHEFESERALGGAPADEYVRMGEAWERLGDPRRAAGCYRRELAVHADNNAAWQALTRLNASVGGR